MNHHAKIETLLDLWYDGDIHLSRFQLDFIRVLKAQIGTGGELYEFQQHKVDEISRSFGII